MGLPDFSNPQIGDVCNRSHLGLQGRAKMIYSACLQCGAPRWTLFKNYKTSRCRKCACREGQKRAIEKQKKGGHRKDCKCGACSASRGLMIGDRNPAWKEGRVKHAGGYVYQMIRGDHPYFEMVSPRCRKVLIDGSMCGYVMQHRLVMAESINRSLAKNETVHHKNGVRNDNRIENLELWVGNHGNGQRAHDLMCPHCGKSLIITVEPNHE